MPSQSKHFKISPSQGGRLMTAFSYEEIGQVDYVEKTNFRRVYNRESRREGYVKFQPRDTHSALVQYNPGLGSDVNFLGEIVWPNGQRFLVAASPDKIAWFKYSTGHWHTLVSGITPGRRWQSASTGGYLILSNGVELPYVLGVDSTNSWVVLSRLYELRESGMASAGCISEFNGMLLLGDIRVIKDASLPVIMNGSDPYGPVADADVTRIQFRIMWSDLDPLRYALILNGTINLSDKDKVVLPFPVSSNTWGVGENMAIIGAGPNEGVLGGQEGIEEGDPITNIAGNVLTLQEPADSHIDDLAYPLSVQITRFADVSSLVGYYDIEEDGSRIKRIMPLAQNVIIYKDRSIYTGRYTSDATAPYEFTCAYRGLNTPYYEYSLFNLLGQYHVYATASGIYRFYGVDIPVKDQVLTLCEDKFYGGLTAADMDNVFAADNAITQEMWLFSPAGVLCYSYKEKDANWIDDAYGAACHIVRPAANYLSTSGENWFVMSKAGMIFQYGLSESLRSYLRDGAAYESFLKHGFFALGDEYGETDISAYVLLLATGGVDLDAAVTVWGVKNPAFVPRKLFTRTITKPTDRNIVPCLYRDIYFQDEIRVTGKRDCDFPVAGFIFEMAPIMSRGVVRSRK